MPGDRRHERVGVRGVGCENAFSLLGREIRASKRYGTGRQGAWAELRLPAEALRRPDVPGNEGAIDLCDNRFRVAWGGRLRRVFGERPRCQGGSSESRGGLVVESLGQSELTPPAGRRGLAGGEPDNLTQSRGRFAGALEHSGAEKDRLLAVGIELLGALAGFEGSGNVASGEVAHRLFAPEGLEGVVALGSFFEGVLCVLELLQPARDCPSTRPRLDSVWVRIGGLDVRGQRIADRPVASARTPRA